MENLYSSTWFGFLKIMIIDRRINDVFRNICSWNKNQEIICCCLHCWDPANKNTCIKWSCQILDVFVLPAWVEGHTTSSSLLYVDSFTVNSVSLSGGMSCCSLLETCLLHHRWRFIRAVFLLLNYRWHFLSCLPVITVISIS